jgi:hypothetical protein
VCGVFQAQWGTVSSPQIFENAMSLVQANISGLSYPDVGSFIYFSQGVPVAVIAAWIGHKDASLTMRLYEHSIGL